MIIFPDISYITIIFGYALHEKGLQRQTKRRYTGSQPETKSGRHPANKPLVNRGSTGRFVPPSVYIGIPLFVLPKKRSGQLSTMPRRVKGTVLFWANRRTAPPPRRPAVRRPAPTSPWYVRVLDSKNKLKENSRPPIQKLAMQGFEIPLTNSLSTALQLVGNRADVRSLTCLKCFRTIL